MTGLRDVLETRQIEIYFAATAAAALVGLTFPAAAALETAINPALALMLFVTFLQTPLRELGRAARRIRFIAALSVADFIAVPLLVAALIGFLPDDPLLRLGVLLVLLAPCIDYVVTFSHLGRADAGALLAATPVLLAAQMLLLPPYLRFFLGEEAAAFIQPEPFIHAFLTLIAGPLAAAAAVQRWAGRSRRGAKAAEKLGLLPVPSTALVLFVVVAAVAPQLEPLAGEILRVVPVYVAFAVAAPFVGWWVGRLFRLDAASGRAVAFSAATRNSLVVLPLAFAAPGAVPLVPAIIVAQTLVELVGELFYIRLLPRLGRNAPPPPPAGA